MSSQCCSTMTGHLHRPLLEHEAYTLAQTSGLFSGCNLDGKKEDSTPPEWTRHQRGITIRKNRRLFPPSYSSSPTERSGARRVCVCVFVCVRVYAHAQYKALGSPGDPPATAAHTNAFRPFSLSSYHSLTLEHELALHWEEGKKQRSDNRLYSRRTSQSIKSSTVL